jgi:hypothetical protein
MEASFDNFFSGPEGKLLKEKDLLLVITKHIPADSAEFYNLTFQAAFAKRIFDIIIREGSATQGIERMQQSFRDSVEKIRAILLPYENNNGSFKQLTSSTPEARAKLSRLIEDLALLKNWLMRHEAR